MILNQNGSTKNDGETFHNQQKDIFAEWFIYLMQSIYVITLSLGLFGNIINILIITLKKTMRRSIHFYMVNLAVADLALLLVHVPIQLKVTHEPRRPIGRRLLKCNASNEWNKLPKNVILQETHGEFKNEFYKSKLSSHKESTLIFAPNMF